MHFQLPMLAGLHQGEQGNVIDRLLALTQGGDALEYRGKAGFGLDAEVGIANGRQGIEGRVDGEVIRVISRLIPYLTLSVT